LVPVERVSETTCRHRARLVPVLAVALSLLAPNTAVAKKPRPAAKCARAKLSAVSKELTQEVRCYQNAITGGGTLHLACLARAQVALAAAFGRAEANGGCATSGDAAAVEMQIDGDVSALVGALTPITITTTPPTTSTTTTASTTTITTTTMPACLSLGEPCGTCGSGTCQFDANGFSVCAGGLCSGGPCAADVECGAGMVCTIVGTETGSTTTCCTACP
jgi:hypothetical protein